jgi:thioredoxin-dependent peroxiredoxin
VETPPMPANTPTTPPVNPGEKAPDFALPDQGGTAHRLADYAGRPLVLYFYPKDGTEDCTIEACSFRDATPAFGKLDAAILGVSPDDAKTHGKFAAKHDLGFPLLADPKPASPVCRAYGTFVEKSMYGRPVTTIARTTYLIDGKGVVRARWDKDEIEADVAGHPAKVKAAVQRLLKGDEPKPGGAVVEVKAKKSAKKTAKKAVKKKTKA